MYFSFLQNVQTSSGLTLPLMLWAPGRFTKGKTCRGGKLTTHLHLLPRMRINGAVLLLRLYAFMAWAGTAVPLCVRKRPCGTKTGYFLGSWCFHCFSFNISPGVFYFILHSDTHTRARTNTCVIPAVYDYLSLYKGSIWRFRIQMLAQKTDNLTENVHSFSNSSLAKVGIIALIQVTASFF